MMVIIIMWSSAPMELDVLYIPDKSAHSPPPQIQERRGLEEYTVRRSLCHLNITRAAYSTIPQLCGISSFGPVVDLSCRGRQYSVKFQQPLVLINKTLVKSQAVGLSEHERLHIFYRRSIGRVDLSRRIN